MIIFLGHSRDWSAVWWFMAGMSEHWDNSLGILWHSWGLSQDKGQKHMNTDLPYLGSSPHELLASNFTTSGPEAITHAGHMQKCREGQRSFNPLPFPPAPPKIDVVAELGGEGCCWPRTNTTMFLFPLSQEMSEEINFSPLFPSLLSYPNYSTEAFLWLKRLTSRYN